MYIFIKLVYIIITAYIAVFLHEFGHYVLMKYYHVKVRDLQVGDGKHIFSFKIKNLNIVFKCIPRGGICVFNNPYDFICLTKYKKIAILINGMIFNLIFGLLGFAVNIFLKSLFIRVFMLMNFVFVVAFFISINDENSDIRTIIRLYKNKPYITEKSLEKEVDSLKPQIEDIVNDANETIEVKIENVKFLINFLEKEYGFPDRKYIDKNENVNKKLKELYEECLHYKNLLSIS